MRFTLALLLLLTTSSSAQGPSSNEISANFIIPSPTPSADLADFKTMPGRTTLTIDVDGATLHGFRYEGKDPKAPTVLFFNGNGMTIHRSDPLYRSLAALGPTVIAFDYRAYGFSTGKPDLATYRNDALHLYDTIAVSTPNRRVIVYGFSMGTTMASYIANQRPVAGLILAAPIASAAAEYPVYGHLIGYSDDFLAAHKPSQDAVDIFGEAALVSKSTAPLLVLHGTVDYLIPVDQAREVFAASPATNKQFVEIPGANHNQTAGSPTSLSAFSRFITSLSH